MSVIKKTKIQTNHVHIFLSDLPLGSRSLEFQEVRFKIIATKLVIQRKKTTSKGVEKNMHNLILFQNGTAEAMENVMLGLVENINLVKWKRG